ncbi:DUF2812 domain-containing protein [Clostridium sp. LP20]|uniref:DUF2812 domain-containing protein n=1 Tax=Clostridium sp. LP20 TaxID=3418665 RepID=UPI003EE67939
MGIMNSKWVLFDILPYEYKALEKYLEDMALKGWKLQGIWGILLKFTKIEPKRIKYSVDIMDKVSFFDGKNCDNVLGYREYCIAAGWEFVCEREKIQVYCSEEDIERIPIHTDENEKFNCIFKGSLKSISMNLVMIISLLFMQYVITISSHDANFLASNLQLVTLIMVMMISIYNIIGIINFIIWVARSKGSLKRDEAGDYYNFKGVSIRRVIHKLELGIVLILVLLMAVDGDEFALKAIILNLLMAGILAIVMKFISRSKYKKKKRMNIIAYILITIILFIGFNYLISEYSWSMWKMSNLEDNNYILTLKDFNDEVGDEDYLYVNEDNSIFAYKLYYSNKGKNINLSYDLLESKYEWIIKYDLKKIMNWMNEIDIKYIEKKTDLPEDIKVYMNEKAQSYLIVSPNKRIEINSWDNSLSEDELINKVYEKVFKE